jgi:SnoaL-like protein
MADTTPRDDLHPPHQHADGRSPTAEEQRNLATMERFRELYNGDDMERFVRESYAPTFHVLNLDGSSWSATKANRQNLLDDSDVFIRAQVFIRDRAPGRRMTYRRLIASGNVVTVEASIVDDARAGWELSWCGIYTFDADGRIVSDHTYLNRHDWPGISELLGRPRS